MSIIHYKSNIKTDYGNTYRLEIHEVDNSADNPDGTAVDFTLTAGGFELSYSKGKQIMQPNIMPSSLSFGFLVQNSTENTFITTISNAPNLSYFVKIYKNNNLWWAGYLENNFTLIEDKDYPFAMYLKANDSLNKLLDKYNNSVQLTNTHVDLRYPLHIFFNYFGLSNIWGSTAKKLNVGIRWYNNQNTNTNSERDDIDASTETYYNRLSFMEDNSNFPYILKNRNHELEGMIKFLGSRLMLSGGRYYFYQDNIHTVDRPKYFEYTNANDAASTSPITADKNVQIANSLPIGANINNIRNAASILTNSSFLFKNELNSVRARFVHGDYGVYFDSTETYTAQDSNGNLTLTTIGFFGNDSSNALLLNLNLFVTENFASAAGFATNQENNISGHFDCTLKVNNKYLKGNIAPMVNGPGVAATPPSILGLTNYEWTDDSTDTFSINFISQSGEGTISSIEGTSITTSILASIGIPSPPTFGEAKFGFTSTIFYLPTGTVNQLLQLQFDQETIATNPPNINTNIGTPLSSSTQGINNLNNFASTIQAVSSQNSSAAINFGAEYVAAQNPSINNPDKDLGDVKLGVSFGTETNTVKNLKYKDTNNNFQPITGMNIQEVSSTINPTLLLCKEYLKGANFTNIILQGSILSPDYEAHKKLYYNRTGETGAEETYLFLGGKFIAAYDRWDGDWYKFNPNDNTTFESNSSSNTTIITDPTIFLQDSNLTTAATNPGIAPINFNNSLNVGTDTIAVITTDVVPDSSNNNAVGSISMSDGIITKLIDNQELIITNGSNSEIVKVSGNTNANSTSITLKNTTLKRTYKAGSLLKLRLSDLTNFVGGTSTGSGTSNFNDLEIASPTISNNVFNLSTTPSVNQIIKFDGNNFILTTEGTDLDFGITKFASSAFSVTSGVNKTKTFEIGSGQFRNNISFSITYKNPVSPTFSTAPTIRGVDNNDVDGVQANANLDTLVTASDGKSATTTEALNYPNFDSNSTKGASNISAYNSSGVITYTITLQAIFNSTRTAFIKLNFQNKIYYGMFSGTTLSSANLLSGSFSSNFVTTSSVLSQKSFTANNNRVFFAHPNRISAPTSFTINGFGTSMSGHSSSTTDPDAKTFSFQNDSGFVETYRFYYSRVYVDGTLTFQVF